MVFMRTTIHMYLNWTLFFMKLVTMNFIMTLLITCMQLHQSNFQNLNVYLQLPDNVIFNRSYIKSMNSADFLGFPQTSKKLNLILSSSHTFYVNIWLFLTFVLIKKRYFHIFVENRRKIKK